MLTTLVALKFSDTVAKWCLQRRLRGDDGQDVAENEVTIKPRVCTIAGNTVRHPLVRSFSSTRLTIPGGGLISKTFCDRRS